MQPVNSKTFVQYGDSIKRLGQIKRTESYDKTKELEELIINTAAFPAATDVFPTQAPFFTEFVYTDMLGGMLLRSASAEINIRVARRKPLVIPSQENIDLFLSGIKDKYQQKTSNGKVYKKVAFICGTNIFDQAVDTQKLYEAMDTNPDMVIKPHPLTADNLLRNLGGNFGYSRILDKDISANELLQNCETAYTMYTSEIAVVATLAEKNVIDLTNYTARWRGISYTFMDSVKNIQDKKEKRDTILAAILDDCSGFVHPKMSVEEQTTRINTYCEAALEERKPFEMITGQRLSVVMQTRHAQPPQQKPPENKKETKNEDVQDKS